jgi:hypothetical protein
LRVDDREPPLSNGLKTLTPAQNALAEFLMLDPDEAYASTKREAAFRAV